MAEPEWFGKAIKPEETKSWASNDVAKTNYTLLLFLTHNRMILMEELIRVSSGIDNEAEHKRRSQRRKEKEELQMMKGEAT